MAQPSSKFRENVSVEASFNFVREVFTHQGQPNANAFGGLEIHGQIRRKTDHTQSLKQK